MEVGTGISAATTEITNIIMKRRGYTTTTWEGYKKTSFDILERLKRSLYVFGTGEGDTRGKQVRKSCHFFLKISVATDLFQCG